MTFLYYKNSILNYMLLQLIFLMFKLNKKLINIDNDQNSFEDERI